MNEFDLMHQWQAYLQRIGLTEDKMHPIQITEAKRAFHGAAGQLLITFRDEILNNSKADEILEFMIQQVLDFWLNENEKQNG